MRLSFGLVVFGTNCFLICSGCDDAELSKVQERFVCLPYGNLSDAYVYLSFQRLSKTKGYVFFSSFLFI